MAVRSFLCYVLSTARRWGEAIIPELPRRLGMSPFNATLCNKAILILAFDTGLWLSEITNLKLSDIGSEMITATGKGSKQRAVGTGAKAQKAVWR